MIRRVGHILFVVGLLGIVTGVFLKSQEDDVTRHHLRIMALEELKRWNMTLNQDILRNKNGLLLHYDSLVIGIQQLHKRHLELNVAPFALARLDEPSLSQLLDEYGNLLAEKEKLVERFKSQQAILRNSQRYFPFVSAQLQELFMDAEDLQPGVYVIEKALRQTLLFSQHPDEAGRVRVRASLNELISWQLHTPPSIREKLTSLITHLTLILEYRSAVDTTITDIFDGPLDTVHWRLTQAYGQYYAKVTERANHDRWASYGLAILLVCYVAAILMRLRKAAQALRDANATLEDRLDARPRLHEDKPTTCGYNGEGRTMGSAKRNPSSKKKAKCEQPATFFLQEKRGEYPMNGHWKREKIFVSTAASFMTVLFAMVALVSGSPVYGETGLGTPPAVRGPNLSLDDLIPGDVFARVGLVQQELELIRFEMGKPPAERSHALVTQAAPREVFSQALTLYEKASRLAFEQTGALAPALPMELPAASELRPGHVWKMVDAALIRLLLVKEHLALEESVQETLEDPQITPTNVFQRIVATNRQLNVLLERRFAPRDVYRQVTFAMHYTARLLAHFPKVSRLPPSVSYEHGKRPNDVYGLLGECYARVGAIAAISGLEVLRLDLSHTTKDVIRPSDVYDIASLLISDLAYLHSQLPGTGEPNQAYDPGRKFPSHVYQRVSRLLAQLRTLERKVQANPQWLKG